MDTSSPAPRAPRRRAGSRSAPVLIGCSFAGAAVAAWQVYHSSCAQMYTARRATLAYAQTSAALVAADAEHALGAGARLVFRDVPAGAGAAAVRRAAARAAAEAERCRCAVVPAAALAARVDLDGGRVEIDPAPRGAAADSLGAELRAWAARAARADGAAHPAAIEPATLGGAARLVAWRVARDGAGRARAVHLVAAAPDAAARAALALAAARRDLVLPGRALGVRADSVLALELRDAAGRAVYRAALDAPPASRDAAAALRERLRDAFPVPFPAPGGLTIRAAVLPAYVDAVAGDVWSWDQAQLIIGLLTVTTGLGVVALLQYRRERAMTQLRGEFVAAVSHELRTPLAQIRMFSEMLRLGWVRSDDERARAVEVIDQEARRLTQLVENVLRFSSAERGGGGAAAAPCAPLAVAPFVREVVDAFAPLAASRGARVEPRPGCDGWHVMADRDALWQILVNLLDNAAKYGPAGQTVRVGASDAGAGRVALTVDDEGPGIPPAERGRVWEPFHRLARDRAAGTTGSGIGLSVVRELTRALGGEATVGDAPGGRGTRVAVVLPGTYAPAAPAVPAVPATPAAPSAPPAAAELPALA